MFHDRHHLLPIRLCKMAGGWFYYRPASIWRIGASRKVYLEEENNLAGIELPGAAGSAAIILYSVRSDSGNAGAAIDNAGHNLKRRGNISRPAVNAWRKSVPPSGGVSRCHSGEG